MSLGHIVYLSYTYWPPDFGGELLITIERFTEFVKRGHRVTVLTAGAPGQPDTEIRDGIHILRSPSVGESKIGRLMRRLVFLFWALSRLHRLKYDILHCAQMAGIEPVSEALSGWYAARLAHRRGARVVVVHSLADSERNALDLTGLRGKARRLFLGQADDFVAVSPALYESVVRVFPQQARLIPCGVRDDLFAPLPADGREVLRSEMGADAQSVVFAFLGSLARRKGFDLLAQAFLQVGPGHPHWQLWVIGPRSRAENQNLTDDEVGSLLAPLQQHLQVKFLGRIDDRRRLAGLLAASDIFVFPSRREGMGIAPLEAMAAGVPVIVSRLPGITDLANIEGVTGLYVNPGSISELAEAMLQLGEDTFLRSFMGEAARDRILHSFGWQQHLDQWEQVYRGKVKPEVD